MDKTLKSLLELATADIKVFNYLNGNKFILCQFSTEKLAEKLNLNLTTVQRAVKKLSDHTLIKQKKINLSGGGYRFEYRCLDKSELLIVLKSFIKKFDLRVITYYKNLL